MSQPGEDRPRTEPGLVPIGRIAGIPVYVSTSWFVIAVVLTFLYAEPVRRAIPGIGSGAFVVAFTFALLLYLSVLLHELGHSVVARRLGLPVRRITIHALVGLSEIEEEPQTPGREFLVAAAGPAVSVVLAVASAGVATQLPPGSVLRVVAFGLAFSNAVVSVLNLLPGLPLDGGRILRAALWKVTGDERRSVVISAHAGRVVAVLIALAPLGLAWATDRPAQLWDIMIFALVGAFVWAGASQTLRTQRTRDALPALTAGSLARRAAPVTADLPLSEAIRVANAGAARALVVVDPDGRPTAIVSEAAVVATPVDRRPWITVGSLSRRLLPEMVVGADAGGMDLLQSLERVEATEYLVVDRTGAVYGVLASEDVQAALARLR